MEHIWTYITTFLLSLVSLLLIFIILLQRGRGGGLAGAFGGLGGQSAFGTKAGDVFTKITVVLAVIWVCLAGLSGYAMVTEATQRFAGAETAPVVESQEEDETEQQQSGEGMEGSQLPGQEDGGPAGVGFPGPAGDFIPEGDTGSNTGAKKE